MRWWTRALFPIVAGILPLKEIGEGKRGWYCFLRWLKFVLLWLALFFIAFGARRFIESI